MFKIDFFIFLVWSISTVFAAFSLVTEDKKGLKVCGTIAFISFVLLIFFITYYPAIRN